MFVCSVFFFYFIDTATTEIYTLSLHDALPICWGFRPRAHRRRGPRQVEPASGARAFPREVSRPVARARPTRSEEHTSELQSRLHLVCRLLLEKKKYNIYNI